MKDNKEFIYSLEHLIRQMPGFVAWKTTDSKYASTNELCAKLAGYKNIDSYLGTTDYDWKCEAVEIADQIKKQDELVLKTQEQWNSFNVLKFRDGNLTHYISQKSILKNPYGEVLGILFIGTILTDSALLKSLTSFTQHNLNQNNNKIQCSIYPIVDENSSHLNLTLREHEVLYYILRGKTAKEVGKILNISNRTVESYIQHLKNKFSCNLKSELIEKAIEQGYIFHIPASIVPLVSAGSVKKIC